MAKASCAVQALRLTDIPNVGVSIAEDLQGLGMLSALEEGTTTRDATRIAEEQERLGAAIDTSGSIDRSAIVMSALTANLAPSLALLSDVLLHPAFGDHQVSELTAMIAARTMGVPIHRPVTADGRK